MNLILRNGYPYPYPDGLTEAQQNELSQAAPGHTLTIPGVVHFEQMHTTTVEFDGLLAYQKAMELTGWTNWSDLILEAPTSAPDGYAYPAIVVKDMAYCGYTVLAAPAPTPEDRKQIADALRMGVACDIWYDAADYDDKEKEEQIEAAQNAMNDAADLLDPPRL